MKKTLLLKLVRQEFRRILEPTALIGKRGPARNVHIIIERHFEKKRPTGFIAVPVRLGMSE